MAFIEQKILSGPLTGEMATVGMLMSFLMVQVCVKIQICGAVAVSQVGIFVSRRDHTQKSMLV